MAFTTISSGLFPSNPRAGHIAVNRMHASIVWSLSQSASEQAQMFAIPPNCFVVGGAIKASQQTGVSGQAIFKVGTGELDNAFGTYTVSGGAVLQQRLNIFSPVTVSTSDDVVPFQRVVQINVTSGASATLSMSIYLLLEYIMPGNIN